jgi:hypothetical protein
MKYRFKPTQRFWESFYALSPSQRPEVRSQKSAVSGETRMRLRRGYWLFVIGRTGPGLKAEAIVFFVGTDPEPSDDVTFA